jgi:hypothetical protein
MHSLRERFGGGGFMTRQMLFNEAELTKLIHNGTVLTGPCGLAPIAFHRKRLLRVEPEHSGVFDTTLDTLLEAPRVRLVIDRHRRQYLRAVHGQRCRHARPQTVRAL